jgi:hypothetical protein
MDLTFAKRAIQAIDRGLENDAIVFSLLLDIVRACSLMAAWMWDRDSNAQAIVMTAKAVR